MKLGLGTGYWSSGPPAGIEQTIQLAEDLEFDSMWAAEAYGSDCLTPLAWWGAKTKKIKLGTSIAQISARTPAALAMAAMTLDHLSEGRVILGIGASGPQVVEGWYGQPYPRPLERTREYVSILRKIFAREDRVEFEGNHYQLPHPGGMRLGKALKSTLHPFRTDIPVYLAAEGPRNVALAAEIADGWLPLFFSPKMDGFYREALEKGFAASGGTRSAENFEVASMVPILVSDDVEAAANFVRPMLSLYMGGMGAKGANFHYDVFVRLGYEDVAEHVQALYLKGEKQEATASIPLKLVEDVALIGPMAKIREELPRWKDTCLTTMMVSGPPQLLETVADVVLS
ncbi:MAG TPA: LLM class F420-dependent oxidoreductase [Dehalococcoidia bacterium]|nr:LLM class F420-dependent oxidoreductase [Dehalococcoidia bacterium]